MNRLLCIIVTAVAVLVTIFAVSIFRNPVEFTGMADAKNKLEAKGFYCIRDSVSASNGGFMVSKKLMTHEEVVALTGNRTRDSLPGDLAWLEVIENKNGFSVVPNGNNRMMGRVCAQGSRQFLDTMEEALR
jgi:hypothetical protein